MKKKKAIFISLIIIVGIIIYIGLSTYIVKDKSYRSLAWNYENHDKNIHDWESAKVTLVKLTDKQKLTMTNSSSKINRKLLFLNGDKAICVTFYVYVSVTGKLEPLNYYFNPFTKQFIGLGGGEFMTWTLYIKYRISEMNFTVFLYWTHISCEGRDIYLK